jgi:hypothetical protein
VHNDINIYLNFTLYAVLGKMGEADMIMQLHGDQVRHVARFLTRECPFTERPIYRGLLLDPQRHYSLDPSFSFMSWSEARDVAVWFADQRSSISEPFAVLHPEARGYLAELPAPCSEVLFHHSWATRAFDDLPSLALQHPDMGLNGVRQIEWALRTQQEVITSPCEIDPKPLPAPAPAELARLDRRLSPPWISLSALTPSQGCGVWAG